MSKLSTFVVLLAIGCGSSPKGGDDDTPPDAAIATPDAAPPAVARAQAGGDVRAIALVDHRAYITVGPRLTIWDVTDPAAPVLRGETDALEGVLEGVAVVGTHAYVSQNGDLDGRVRVIDVADPAAPKVVGSLRLAAAGESTVPRGVAADATRVFVADQEHGVDVLDVADPAAPKIVKTIDAPGVTGVQIVGARLYVMFKGFTDDFAVDAYDLSKDLARIGGTSFQFAASVAITDGNLAVATGIGGQQARDLSNLAAPKDLTMAGSTPDALRVVASASTVWIAAFDGLYVVDLSKPGTATVGPKLDVPTQGAEAAAVSGNLLGLVTQRGRLVAIDVTAPATPVVKSTADVSLCTDCGGIAIAGDGLFIGDHGAGLRTGTVQQLAIGGRADLPDGLDFEDVAVAGGTAYVADWFFGMRAYDVSTPSAPKPLGTVDTDGYPSAIAVEGARAYLGESTNGGALRVLDVTDPAHPSELGAIATSFVWSLIVRDKLVYVCDQAFNGGAGGLHIFDASDPAKIKQIGSYEACGDVLGVALAGTTAVIACEGARWQILDLTDLASIKKLGEVTVASPASATAVAIDGKRAYLGHSFGVKVVDLTDPTKPAVITERPTAYEVRDLQVTKPGHVVASCGAGGVYQWDVP
jgi:hypothetical protein